MTSERLVEFRDAMTKAIDSGLESVRVEMFDGENEVRFLWHRDGLDIVSGDGVDVRLTPNVLRRLMAALAEVALPESEDVVEVVR